MKAKLLYLTLFSSFLVGILYFKMKSEAPNKIEYQEHLVVATSISNTILATGIVKPQNRLEIKAPIAGRVESILIKEGQVVMKGQVLAWISSTERAAMLDAARSQSSDEYKKWNEYYQATAVVAPINGTIILKNVEPGQTFTTSDAIFVMSDKLTVKAQVDETDLAKIRVKSSAKIILDAYPGKEIDAFIDKVAFDATTVNNVTTYLVDVVPLRAFEIMRSGMTANVSIVVEKAINVLAVPSEAISYEDGEYSVLVKDAKGGANKRVVVKVGISDGNLTQIKSGLSEKTSVLTPKFQLSSEGGADSSPFGMPKMNKQKGGMRPPGP